MLGLTSAAHALVHLYELAFPAIALSMKDSFGWTLAEALRISFCMYLLFGLGALPMGILTDRFGARRMLVVCLLGSGVGALAVASSQSRVALGLSLAWTGLAASIYHPAGMSLLSGSRRRGKALGLNGVFGNLGSALGPFAGGLLAYAFGWRTAYALLGGLGIAIGIVALALRFEAGAARPAVVAVPAARADLARRDLSRFAVLCAAMLLAGFSYRGLSVILPAAMESRTHFLAVWLQGLPFSATSGLDSLAATLLASAAYTIGMFGQWFGGHVADRFDLRRAYLMFHLSSIPFLIAMAFAHEMLFVGATCAFVFFALGMQPVENSLVAHFTPARWRATGYGIKFALNFGVGSTAVFAVTALAAGGEFASVFGLLSVVVALLCAVVAFLIVWSGASARFVNEAKAEPVPLS